MTFEKMLAAGLAQREAAARSTRTAQRYPAPQSAQEQAVRTGAGVVCGRLRHVCDLPIQKDQDPVGPGWIHVVR